MMYVNSELDDNAWENNFRSLARDAGLEKLAITVTYMCRKWLGLPKAITWCDGADEALADSLLERIFIDGNFGSERPKLDSVSSNLRKKGGFRYLQQAGLINWPLAQKYAFVRPFAWLYQLGRYCVKGVVGLFRGEKMFNKSKPGMQLDELISKLEG